jgi:hypothetical protein
MSIADRRFQARHGDARAGPTARLGPTPGARGHTFGTRGYLHAGASQTAPSFHHGSSIRTDQPPLDVDYRPHRRGSDGDSLGRDHASRRDVHPQVPSSAPFDDPSSPFAEAHFDKHGRAHPSGRVTPAFRAANQPRRQSSQSTMPYHGSSPTHGFHTHASHGPATHENLSHLPGMKCPPADFTSTFHSTQTRSSYQRDFVYLYWVP